ncbi:MAG: M23 family metallopeptidase, partial [Bacteroidota bacterium]
GIDSRTDQNAQVYAVFEGEVVQVFHDPVLKYAIMIKHGNYYTVYANIRTKEVAKGDTITSGQLIGQVDTREGKSELHFEVWKDKDYQNPTTWIARK